MTADEVQELKEKGNACVRENRFEEAMLYYTHAIKLDPKNCSLYSNRSLTFLKMQQYYFALEDAKETISLKPDWAKGYFRKGEVEFATYNFTDAILSYRIALSLQPNDPAITAALARTCQERKKDLKADEQIPWLGAGLGIIIGVIIVIADQVLVATPTLAHPVLMALLTIAIAIIGYGIARGFRYYVTCQREGLLEPPVDLLPDDNKQDGDSAEESGGGAFSGTPKSSNNSHRYTKAQARFRFRKGKKS